jgi:hypothetical protein
MTNVSHTYLPESVILEFLAKTNLLGKLLERINHFYTARVTVE